MQVFSGYVTSHRSRYVSSKVRERGNWDGGNTMTNYCVTHLNNKNLRSALSASFAKASMLYKVVRVCRLVCDPFSPHQDIPRVQKPSSITLPYYLSETSICALRTVVERVGSVGFVWLKPLLNLGQAPLSQQMVLLLGPGSS